ncbi:MAG: redox-sensing transcriptional repressor Rex [Clostridia bacterium]|nr:redox-sensing transcriptional repressor Rex [Clostridia bacterium]
MHANNISKATLGRLPLYLQYLKSLPDSCKTISATVIAKGLSLGEVQVRKDLATVSGKGRPRIGYETEKLISDIECHLGYEGLTNAILVGAGKLGKALLDFDGFEEYGVKIIAAFDCNEQPMRIGRSDKPVLPIRELSSFCGENKVRIGIITTGQGSAQEVADEMVRSGIKAVWNFAPCELSLPEGVLLKQENLALSLAYLKNQIG